MIRRLSRPGAGIRHAAPAQVVRSRASESKDSSPRGQILVVRATATKATRPTPWTREALFERIAQGDLCVRYPTQKATTYVLVPPEMQKEWCSSVHWFEKPRRGGDYFVPESKPPRSPFTRDKLRSITDMKEEERDRYYERVLKLLTNSEYADLLLDHPAILRFLVRFPRQADHMNRFDIEYIIRKLTAVKSFVIGQGRYFVEENAFRAESDHLLGFWGEKCALVQMRYGEGRHFYPYIHGRADFQYACVIPGTFLVLDTPGKSIEACDNMIATIDLEKRQLRVHTLAETKAFKVYEERELERCLWTEEVETREREETPMDIRLAAIAKQLDNIKGRLLQHGVRLCYDHEWWPLSVKFDPIPGNQGEVGVMMVPRYEGEPGSLMYNYPVYRLDTPHAHLEPAIRRLMLEQVALRPFFKKV